VNILNVFNERLPSYGFATDDLARGLRFVPLSVLIQKAIIQFNWRHSVGFLAYDVDSDNALFDWQDRGSPAPNIIAMNPGNGHAHYLYGLETPVHKYAGASGKALRYLAAVDVAMTAELQADPGYSKLLCKNPGSIRWHATYPRPELWTLDELASWLDMSAYEDRRRRLPTVGLGRNCTLFETLRLWAYRARRAPFLNEELFYNRVLQRGLALNAGFEPPLPHNEVRSTAKSIARWTWQRMSAEGFREWQRRQSAKATLQRKERALELRAKIFETKQQCPTLTQADLAAIHGINQSTISRHLKDYASSISDNVSSSRPSGPLPAQSPAALTQGGVKV